MVENKSTDNVELKKQIKNNFKEKKGKYCLDELTPEDIVDIFQNTKARLEVYIRECNWMFEEQYKGIIELERAYAYESIQCVESNLSQKDKDLWFERLK